MAQASEPASSTPTMFLRNGVGIVDPLSVLLGFVEASGRFDAGDGPGRAPFSEADVRRANRGGARISAVEMGTILERGRAIERALKAIGPDASLTQTDQEIPWRPLRQLFDAFVDIRGVGFSKMTKILHPKRPALIPMLDSIVQKYLADDDPGAGAAFGERALALVHGYKHDLDHNRATLRALRQELAERGFRLTEVRILDLLILSVAIAPAKPKT
jgi:hypothetical protein